MGDLEPSLEDQDAGAELFDQMQQVRAEHDGSTLRSEASDRVLHPADGERIQAGERFVEEHHPRRMQEAAGDLDLLLHPARKVARQLIRLAGQLQFLQQLRIPGGGILDLIKTGGEIEVLPDGEIVEQPGFIREEGQLLLGGHRFGHEVVPGDPHGAAGGWDDPGEGTERGRLASTVGPDEPEEFARLDGEGQPGDGSEVAVQFGQAIHLDHVSRRMRT